MSALSEKAAAAVELHDTPIYNQVFEDTYGPKRIAPVRSATSEPAPLWVYVVLALIALFAVAVVVL